VRDFSTTSCGYLPKVLVYWLDLGLMDMTTKANRFGMLADCIFTFGLL